MNSVGIDLHRKRSFIAVIDDHGDLSPSRRGAKVARVAIARQILTLSYYGVRDREIRRLKTPAPASRIDTFPTA
jgi:hypothetical protein